MLQPSCSIAYWLFIILNKYVKKIFHYLSITSSYIYIYIYISRYRSHLRDSPSTHHLYSNKGVYQLSELASNSPLSRDRLLPTVVCV